MKYLTSGSLRSQYMRSLWLENTLSTVSSDEEGLLVWPGAKELGWVFFVSGVMQGFSHRSSGYWVIIEFDIINDTLSDSLRLLSMVLKLSSLSVVLQLSLLSVVYKWSVIDNQVQLGSLMLQHGSGIKCPEAWSLYKGLRVKLFDKYAAGQHQEFMTYVKTPMVICFH